MLREQVSINHCGSAWPVHGLLLVSLTEPVEPSRQTETQKNQGGESNAWGMGESNTHVGHMGLGKAWCCPAIGILLALGAQQLGRDIKMHRNPGESGNR